jgi:CDP-glucose 4,6-dehydratase
VIGGGDWAEDRLIPDMVRAIGRQAGAIRNPHAIRPWQHVLEPLSGYLTAGRAPVPAHGAGVRRRLELRPARHRRAPGRMDHRAPVRKLGRRRRWELDGRAGAAARSALPQAGLLQGPQPPAMAAALAPGTHHRHDRRLASGRTPGADMRALTLAQIDTYQKRAFNEHNQG